MCINLNLISGCGAIIHATVPCGQCNAVPCDFCPWHSSAMPTRQCVPGVWWGQWQHQGTRNLFMLWSSECVPYSWSAWVCKEGLLLNCGKSSTFCLRSTHHAHPAAPWLERYHLLWLWDVSKLCWRWYHSQVLPKISDKWLNPTEKTLPGDKREYMLNKKTNSNPECV